MISISDQDITFSSVHPKSKDESMDFLVNFRVDILAASRRGRAGCAVSYFFIFTKKRRLDFVKKGRILCRFMTGEDYPIPRRSDGASLIRRRPATALASGRHNLQKLRVSTYSKNIFIALTHKAVRR